MVLFGIMLSNNVRGISIMWKKRSFLIVGLLVCMFALAGCKQTQETNTTTPESTSATVNIPDNFTDGYGLADFNKFNSNASENGLGGSLIYIEGVVGDIETVNSGDEETYFCKVTTDDSKQWLVILNLKIIATKESYTSFVGNKAIICGTYTGYSSVHNMPAMNMVKMFNFSSGEIKDGVGKMELELKNYTEQTTQLTTTTTATTTTATTTTATTKAISLGQLNALGSAKDYLAYGAFSKKGLVEQLEFEGYTKSEANYAVDNCGADWKEQAVKSAKEYLDYSSFSRKGLIEQLKFEGFTSEEAKYGAEQNGY